MSIRRFNRRFAGALVLSAFLLFPSIAGAGEVSFNRDVRPILADRCFACHGPDASERKASLRLDQAEGDEGAYRTHRGNTAIKPGSVEGSELWYRITTRDADEVMPPVKAHKEPLTEEEQGVIRRWIEAGAPYENFWAFVPAKISDLPEVKDREWSQLALDRYVLGRLEAQGLKPSGAADKTTLIRRVTFDLTGLPPTLDEVRAFVADKSPDAYEALVDRLLASPAYGEHMTRYWLDLVRFADTNGMHKDFYRNLIAYRDWVIRAFNDNLGYDDFVRYQLAGDLYPVPSNDQLIASGFNRLHLIIDRGTALPEESFYKNVLDRTTAVSTAFLGLTAQCANCHDHKYDPITQKDFFSLYAFFNNIDAQPETAGRPKDGLQPPFLTLATDEQTEKLKQLGDEIAKLDKMVNDSKKAADGEKDPEKKKGLETALKEATAKRDGVKKQREVLEREVPRAMVMKERNEVRPTNLRVRGQYDVPGELVERNTPAFLLPLKKSGDVATRMDLANWFVDPQNPLTARVAVNRFWQQLFGVGLVKTSEDLGAQGEVPSHPELLDYLAVSLVDSGWDIKSLMKQMVLSKTYQQASEATPENFEKDPENRLLARGSRFRMDAEMIRDQILASSGLMVTKIGGKSVKPPQPDGLWKAVTMIGERFKPDAGDAIYRRSLYTYWKRGMPPPQMTILNAPARDACTARRERTNTPSQALLLLNEGEYLKAARNLAVEIQKTGGGDSSHGIARAYEIVTSHQPDETEMKIFMGLHEELQIYYEGNPKLAEEMCEGLEIETAKEKADVARWTVFINTLFNLDITKTRE